MSGPGLCCRCKVSDFYCLYEWLCQATQRQSVCNDDDRFLGPRLVTHITSSRPRHIVLSLSPEPSFVLMCHICSHQIAPAPALQCLTSSDLSWLQSFNTSSPKCKQISLILLQQTRLLALLAEQIMKGRGSFKHFPLFLHREMR